MSQLFRVSAKVIPIQLLVSLVVFTLFLGWLCSVTEGVGVLFIGYFGIAMIAMVGWISSVVLIQRVARARWRPLIAVTLISAALNGYILFSEYSPAAWIVEIFNPILCG